MDWVDRPQTYEGLYGKFKTLKLVGVAFHSLKF